MGSCKNIMFGLYLRSSFPKCSTSDIVKLYHGALWTGHYLWRRGGGGKKEGAIKATSDWLEGVGEEDFL